MRFRLWQSVGAWFHRRMSRKKKFLRYWLPVIIWMAVIFSASADSQSSYRGSRLIGPLVRFFVPNISQERLDQIIFLVRKTAHVAEYTVLSCLAARALHAPAGSGKPVWSGQRAVIAFLIAALYSCTDELHQAFVPNREARWADVALDSFGALIGVILFWLNGRLRKFW